MRRPTAIAGLAERVHAWRASRTATWLQQPAVHGALLMVIAVVVILWLGAGGYVSYQIQLGAVYAIAVLGLDITAGMGGVLSLASAAAFALGAYVTGNLAGSHGWTMWETLPLALVAGFAGGALFGYPASRLGPIGIAMLSLGCTLVAADVALNAESLTGGFNGINDIPPVVSPGGVEVISLTAFGIALIVVAYVCYVAHWRYRTSRLGRSTVAVRDDALGARSLGISPPRVLMLAFAAGTALGALAGGLYAYLAGVITPSSFGANLALTLLAMVLLGGAGSRLGPLIGAAILTAVPIYLARFPHVNQFLYGSLLIVLVRLMPRGLLPARPPRLAHREWDRPRESAQSPAAATAQADGPALALAGVARHFGGVYALRDVSLEVMPGEVLSLVGPNGSGKTTLLNVVCGYYEPSGGEIRLGGQVLPRRPERVAALGVSRTFQTPKVFSTLSLAEHRALADEHPATTQGDDVHRLVANDLLVRAGLERPMESSLPRPVSTAAHGQLRFLEVAMAIARRPTVLLLDEPAAGLSVQEIELLEEAVQRVARLGTAVVLVEHHLDLVQRVSDRVTVLHLGEVLWSGEPDEMKTTEVVRTAYLGGTVPVRHEETEERRVSS